jgi:hypothetical protein
MGADDKSGSTGTNYKSMAVGPDDYRTMSTETEPEDTGSTEATSKQL